MVTLGFSAPQEPISGFCERGDLVSANSSMPGNSQVQRDTVVEESVEAVELRGGEFGDTQMAMDEIEHLLEIGDNENLSRQEDLMVCDTSEGTCFADTDSSRQQMLMDDLEDIVNADDLFCLDNNTNSFATLIEKDQSNSGTLTNEREGRLDVQQVVIVESRSKIQPQADKKQCASKCSPYDSTFNHGVAKLIDDIEERSSSWRNNELEYSMKSIRKELKIN